MLSPKSEVLTEDTVLHAPEYRLETRDRITYAIAPAVPHWIATDDRGAGILSGVDGGRSCGQIIDRYAAERQTDRARAWLHVTTFIEDALR